MANGLLTGLEKIILMVIKTNFVKRASVTPATAVLEAISVYPNPVLLRRAPSVRCDIRCFIFWLPLLGPPES